jgi:Arc/MetJ family transcription regulator
MATNLDLDDRLIREAVKAGGHRTKREAVNAALREYVQALHRRDFFAMAGEFPELPESAKPLRRSDQKRLAAGAKGRRAAGGDRRKAS